MWLIDKAHLDLIEILTGRRMVLQPATKCIPLVVRLVILNPSIIVIPLETSEWVLLLTLPFKTPTNPIADEIIFNLTYERSNATFENLRIDVPQILTVFGVRAILD